MKLADIDWCQAYEIERDANVIFEKQFNDGWYFDIPLALSSQGELWQRLEEQYDRCRPHLTSNMKRINDGKPWEQPFTKAGKLHGTLAKWVGADEALLSDIGGPLCRVKYEEPNLGSSDQVKDQLYRLGWKPTQWNHKDMVMDPKTKELVDSKKHPNIKGKRQRINTSPKVTEDSFDSLDGSEVGRDIKKFLVYRNRASDFKRYLANVRPDSTIPSLLNNPGTPTARVRHSLITNVPGDDAIFGRQMREVFRARPGRVIVGEDRSQIEARLIAHVSIQVLGHSKMADLILGRDFHQVMFEALDGLVSSRKRAKTPEYAFFFGAGAETLGASCDNKPNEWSNTKCGEEVLGLMEDNIPGIVQVREALGKAAKRGFLLAFDGRKLFIRKPHAALNSYTQGNGAICCKYAMVRQQHEAQRRELDQMQVGMYHDETQNDVAPDDAEEFGNVCVEAIRETGRHFNLNVPLDGDFQIARNWAGSH